jgi:sulfur-oxidizing protein SoxY
MELDPPLTAAKAITVHLFIRSLPQEQHMQTRRDILRHSAAVAGLLATTGLFPRYAMAWTKAAFDGRNLAEVLKALGTGAPAESKDITLTAPDIAENGAVVPFGIATTLPKVKSMLILVEKNPSVLVAKFDVSDAIEPSFSTRAKMGQSSDVYAVAITTDGAAYYAKKEVKVTLGGCGG